MMRAGLAGGKQRTKPAGQMRGAKGLTYGPYKQLPETSWLQILDMDPVDSH